MTVENMHEAAFWSILLSMLTVNWLKRLENYVWIFIAVKVESHKKWETSAIRRDISYSNQLNRWGGLDWRIKRVFELPKAMEWKQT